MSHKICFSCIRNLHGACRKPCECTHEIVKVEDEPESTSSDDNSERESGQRQRRNKPDAAVKDQQSTGRKRAAKLYPLDREAPCEWLGKTGMGGGAKPINGCAVADNCTQQARHHGPDKNTLNNEPGNVHRIGHLCHNRWHAANDPTYQPGMLKGD